jgi:hypothetical protein
MAANIFINHSAKDKEGKEYLDAISGGRSADYPVWVDHCSRLVLGARSAPNSGAPNPIDNCASAANTRRKLRGEANARACLGIATRPGQRLRAGVTLAFSQSSPTDASCRLMQMGDFEDSVYGQLQ